LKKLLIIVFALLWFGNSQFCAISDFCVEHWESYYYGRDALYEGMFAILLTISFYKPDLLSKCLLIFVVTWVFFSMIDKGLNKYYDYHFHDIYVAILSVLLAVIYYLKKTRVSEG
jgi:hypothetical protein